MKTKVDSNRRRCRNKARPLGELVLEWFAGFAEQVRKRGTIYMKNAVESAEFGDTRDQRLNTNHKNLF